VSPFTSFSAAAAPTLIFGLSIVTPPDSSFTLLPLPSTISTPFLSIVIVFLLVLSVTMIASLLSASASSIVCFAVLMILLVGGLCEFPGGGASVVPPGWLKNVPTHTGNSSSPDSNSTHTPSFFSGMKKKPRPACPPYGAQGSAHPETTSPSTL